MLTNYFKIAIRNTLRHKVYSFINIAGLSVGLACAILIMLWVQYELSYDRFHKNGNQIYRLELYWNVGENLGRVPVVQHAAGPTFVKEYPEVLKSVRFRDTWHSPVVQYKDRKFIEDDILFTENTIFDIFTIPMVSGSPGSGLIHPFSVVITEDMAMKYFGNEVPIGKMLKLMFQRMHEFYVPLQKEWDFMVTGVVKRLPENSHFTFNMLLSLETLYQVKNGLGERWWGDINVYTYLLLQESCDIKALVDKFPALIDKYIGEDLKAAGGNFEYFLRPLAHIHLHSRTDFEFSDRGDILLVYAFIIFAVLILVIACINFMNLSTARSTNRAKEIGVRKVLGAHRGSLIYQFTGESLFLSVISSVLAIGLVEFFLPLFRSLTQTDLDFKYLTAPGFILGVLVLVLIVGFIGGSYPALFLSSFQPARILKGTLKTGASNSPFRNILVVFQFTISIALIIAMGIIFKQIYYIENKKLGFDKDNIVILTVMGNTIFDSIDSLKKELLWHPSIKGVSVSSDPLTPYPKDRELFVPQGFDEPQIMYQMSFDSDFIPIFGIKVVAGRNFSRNHPTDRNDAILINETAARQFGWDNPVGKKIRALDSKNTTKIIIGVVKDFHMESLHNKIIPLYIESEPSRFQYISIKVAPENSHEAMMFLKDKWTEFDPAQPFNTLFLDEYFSDKYMPEKIEFKIISYFTFLALFIACMGLFGLALFTAEQRTKEIGIRKALGASISGIILLLSKEFTKWVVVANIIAWPVAYFAMNHWLQNFAYRTTMGPGTFILAALLTLIIALLTVGYQAIKVARANPVEALRYE